ncbi:16S rRNA (cytosine(967)-C(5))-methyltransferase RsmB [Aliiglaciecola sp. M165]|nr:16S rRNA (cytosine(967)-C(5))-methyltransferase RsmB [Aliiglaciecola sp. M165]
MVQRWSGLIVTSQPASQGKGKHKPNLRADTARVLYSILEDGKSARECLPALQARYQDKDKAWMQEMTYGVLRQLPLLQSWLRDMLDKPLKKRFKVVEHLILLGFYQLAFSRVSTHAAVSETVAAAPALQAQSLKGLVNALLRNFIRQEKQQQPITDPHIASGLPKWLYKLLKSAYPESEESLYEQMNQRPPIWLRINRLKTSLSDYQTLLKQQKVEFTLSDEHSQGLWLAKSVDVTTLPGFDDGLFAVQDGAAQLAAEYLDAQPGQHVLDCCAAPGGKTCHIIESQPKLADCTALDVDESRMVRVKENLQRLGHQAKLIVADANDSASWWDGVLYDRILLDAPCSATGVIRRHPDIKWLRKNTDIDVLVGIQQQLLDTMWQLLKPGGVLVYATCSILPEENSQQIIKFLASHADASLLKLSEKETIAQPGRQILPGEKQMDGFYYARLLKS